MKVKLAPTITNQKTNLLTKIKRFFVGKLKPITKDTFEKGSGAKEGKNIIVSRKYPNWCDGPETQYRNNTIAERICYYPEDIKKMETMSENEAILYSRKLYKEGKFYYDDNYHIDTPALDRVTKEYGVDLSKFIIKDKK